MDFVRTIQAVETPAKVKDLLSSKYGYVTYYFDKLPGHIVPGDLMFISYQQVIRAFAVVQAVFPPGTCPYRATHKDLWNIAVGTAKHIKCPHPYRGYTSVPSLDVLESGYDGEYKTLARWLKKRANAFRDTTAGLREIAEAKAKAFDLLNAHKPIRTLLDDATRATNGKQ